MQTVLRSKIAAVSAMLLVPLGAVVAPNAAHAQLNVYVQPAVVAPAAPAIERFVLRMPDHAGGELRYRLVGVPGGRAWIDIPGFASGLPMVETRPGVYEASYVLRRRDSPDAFQQAVASLQNGRHRVTARVDVRGGWDRPGYDRPGHDQRGPQITDVTPSHGDRIADQGRTRISARYGDSRSGVDLSSVQLRVDGRDVTRFSRYDEDSIRYREDLAPGRHHAELVVRDRAGNVSRRSWSFDVVDPDRRYGWGSGAQVIGQRW